MPEAHFALDIPPEQMLRYYRGQAGVVSVIAQDGRSYRFPAAALRPFITAEGIRGRFRIRFDDQNRLVSLDKIG